MSIIQNAHLFFFCLLNIFLIPIHIYSSQSFLGNIQTQDSPNNTIWATVEEPNIPLVMRYKTKQLCKQVYLTPCNSLKNVCPHSFSFETVTMLSDSTVKNNNYCFSAENIKGLSYITFVSSKSQEKKAIVPLQHSHK